jgi:uncharacterized integral membrane protein (TIGR00698 family)
VARNDFRRSTFWSEIVLLKHIIALFYKKKPLNQKFTFKHVLFLIALVLCISPWIDPPLALLMGVVIAQTIGHPYIHLNHKATSTLLKISVVGLGFGMNLQDAFVVGKSEIFFTAFFVCFTLLIGFLLGKLFKVNGVISFLIACGTAICGGSAIAAVAPVVKSDEKQMTVALGVVFILNAVALIIFPIIGKTLMLSQHDFGLWAAYSIHDTSSVVGAAFKYGSEALETATTVKLGRALWIIPLTIGAVIFTKTESKKIHIPYFIAFFILAMCVSTYWPAQKEIYGIFVAIAKKGLTVSLFLIGASLSFRTLKTVGWKPLLQGVTLWVITSVVSLGMIIYLR